MPTIHYNPNLAPEAIKPVITVERINDTWRVLSVGLDANYITEAITIRDQMANLLYQALAGHRFGSNPMLATTMAARTARAVLLRNRSPEARVPKLVILSWGEYIRPWLGCYHIANKEARSPAVLIDLKSNLPIQDEESESIFTASNWSGHILLHNGPNWHLIKLKEIKHE